MLHLVIGPSCAGKSTYIAACLHAGGLGPDHVMFARAALEHGASRVQARLERADTLYLHLASLGPPQSQPRRRRLVTRLTTLFQPIDASLLVATGPELARRARARTSSEPLFSPGEPGSFDAERTAPRLSRFDAPAFVAGWSAELNALGIPWQLVDTGAGVTADARSGA
jgi:hypothetical protein